MRKLLFALFIGLFIMVLAPPLTATQSVATPDFMSIGTAVAVVPQTSYNLDSVMTASAANELMLFYISNLSANDEIVIATMPESHLKNPNGIVSENIASNRLNEAAFAKGTRATAILKNERKDTGATSLKIPLGSSLNCDGYLNDSYPVIAAGNIIAGTTIPMIHAAI